MTDEAADPAANSILICEGEERLAESIAGMLRSLGYEIAKIAKNGEEAVRAAGESHPDLILMDIDLKGDLDGIEAAKQIRARQDVPVVYLAANDDQNVLERAKDTDPYGYLGKTVSVEELRRTVETALYRYRVDTRLQESEEQLRAILDSLHDLVFVINESGVFTDYHNPPDLDKLYLPPEAFLGRHYKDVLPEDVRLLLEEAIDSLENTGVTQQFDYCMEIAGHAEWFSAKVSKRRDVHGRLRGVTILSRDITKIKENQAVLYRKTSLLNSLIEALPDAVYFKDAQRRHVIVNRAYRDFFGLSKQEIIGKTIEEFVAANDAEKSRITDETAIETGLPLVAEHCWPDKGGDNRLFETRKFPIFGESGQIIAVGGISRDITDRKRAEEVLRETKERLETIAQTITEVFWMIDVETGEIIYVSPGFERVWGRSVTDLYMDPFTLFDAIHEADRERVKGLLKVKNKGVPFNHEYRIVRPDGDVRWIRDRGFPVRDESEKVALYVGIAQDITDRKRVEETLRQSEERFRSLIEQAADAIFVHDIEGRFLEVNQQACASLGYTREELLSMSVSDIDPDMERRGDRTKFWLHLPVTFEARNQRKDGTTFPVEIRLGPIIYGNTKVVLALVRDITDRKRAEEEMIRARNEAEAADRAKSEFLATMSHELRTPLNAIIGFSEILEDQTFGPLNEAQTKYVGYVLESGRHLLRLVTEILDLSKIEAGRAGLTLSPIDVRDMLEKTVATLHEQALNKEISVDLNVDSDLNKVIVLGDDLKLRQVMLNLLSNAVKFTSARGTVRVDAQIVEEELMIRVYDTGVGIEPSDNSRIFRAFEQVDSTLSREYQGTGLGLTLARRMVEMHGGRIWVESEGLGKGSTFTFTIPLKNCHS